MVHSDNTQKPRLRAGLFFLRMTVPLFYFQAKNIHTHDALAEEYERRNLKPAEPLALLDAFTHTETSTDLFLTKNGLTQWKDTFGQWRHLGFTLNIVMFLSMLQDVVTPETLSEFEKLVLLDSDDEFGDDQWFVGVE